MAHDKKMIQEVGSLAPGEYLETDAGVVLPHTTSTGVVAGKAAYPPVLCREWVNDKVVREYMSDDGQVIQPPEPKPEPEEEPQAAKGRRGKAPKVAPPPPAQPPPPPPAAVAVLFQGAFGEVEAPFAMAAEGDGCIAVVQAQGSPYRFAPPVNPEAPFTVEWEEAGVRRRVRAVHAGLSFRLPAGRVLVFITVKAGAGEGQQDGQGYD